MLYYRKHLKKQSIFILFYRTSIIIVLLLVNSCAKEPKIIVDNKSFYQEIELVNYYKEILSKKEQHSFSKKIVFKGFKVLSNKKDYYRFIWIIDKKKTDLNELKKWKLGIILKPKDKDSLSDFALKVKGIRSISLDTRIYNFKNDLVLSFENLHVSSKNLDYLKFYIFKTGEFNLKYWTIKDIKLGI